MIDDESNTEVVLVVYNLIAETLTKIEKWLIRRVFKMSLKNVKSLVKLIAGDWMVDHNCMFLYGHVFITWILISYRIYRRRNCPGDRDTVCSKEKEKTESDTMTAVTETSGGDTDTSVWKQDSTAAYLDYQCEFTSSECHMEKDVSDINHEHSSGDNIAKGSATTQDDLPSRRNHRAAVYSESIDPSQDWTPPVNRKSISSIKTLKEALKDVLFFRSLDEEQIKMVINAMKLIKVAKGREVIKEGDEGDYFYVVRSGIFEAGKYVESGEWKPIKKYENSGSFGELSLLYNQPRALTVKCLTGGELWALDRHSFKSLVVKDTYRKRQEYYDFISSVPVLRELTEYERQQVVDALEPRVFPAGSKVVAEGDTADGMYVVMEGTAKVVQTGSEVQSYLARGDYFGEMGLINNKPRAATVIAHTQLNTIFLNKEAFERLLGPAMDIMKRNMERYQQVL